MTTTAQQKICIDCKECCKWLTFILSPHIMNNDMVTFYRTRGCKIKLINDNFHVMVPTTCPHLTEKGCDKYKHRPQKCREYDGRFDPAMKYICKLPDWR